MTVCICNDFIPITCRHAEEILWFRSFCTVMFSPYLKLKLSYIFCLLALSIFHAIHTITLLPHLGDGSFMLSVNVQSRQWYQTQILNVESKNPVKNHLLRIKSSYRFVICGKQTFILSWSWTNKENSPKWVKPSDPCSNALVCRASW